MQNSDLVEILTLLRDEERQQLLAYLEWPSHYRKEPVALVEYILGCLQKGNPTHLAKAKAYHEMFPDDEMPVANKLEKLMSDTLSGVRQFIAADMALNDMREMQQQVYLQRFYRERNLEKKFRQSRNQISKLKEQPGKWSPPDFYFQFLSEEEESMFQSARNQKKDDLNLWSTIRALDEYYLVERLRYTCVLLNQNQLASLTLPPLKDWLPFDPAAEQLKWFFQKPWGQLFRQAIDLFSDEAASDEKKLHYFIQFLTEYEDHIPLEFVTSLEIYACNYGIRQVDKGKISFRRLVFQLQKRRVESGRIYLEKKIKASEFHSIVVTGLRLGEKSWVKQFIEQHKDKIQGVMPSSDYYQFNLVFYYFQTKEYEPELRTLLTSNYEDMLYKTQGKILEIKILYEMSHRPGADPRVAEFLENKVEAAIIFFFREKNIPPDKKKMGKRFADTMKRILHAESKGDIKRLEKIRADVVAFDLIAERQWLLQIIDDLLEKLKKGGKA